MTGKCRICGKEFEKRWHDQVTCLDPKCRETNKKKVAAEGRKRRKLEELEERRLLRERRKDYERMLRMLYPERFESGYGEDHLRIDAAAAKEAGMSYGYYMALVKNGGVQMWSTH